MIFISFYRHTICNISEEDMVDDTLKLDLKNSNTHVQINIQYVHIDLCTVGVRGKYSILSFQITQISNNKTPIIHLYSADTVKNYDGTDNLKNNLYPTEFLNSINVKG